MPELAAPFSLTPSGGVAAVSAPGDIVQQHLKCLVSTNPGERVMRPTYGVPLSSYVFGLSADQVSPLVTNDVTRAIREWEPSVSLQNVQMQTADTPEGMVSIDVQYSPGVAVTGSTQLSTATVLVGGSVVS
jgi:hypothetical protein